MKEEEKPQGVIITQDELQKKLRFSRILNLVLAAGLIFVGGSYAALAMNSSGQAPGAQAVPQQLPEMPEATEQESVQIDAEYLATEEYMILGSADAPVTLYEWTDFTCPYCGVFNRETLPVLIEEYVNTGKVRVEVHDVTYIGPQAEDAAVAARAAGLQDKYFDYLFEVYELGATDNRPDLSERTLFELAEKIGLDMQKFETDFNDTALRTEVQASTAKAQGLGISSVPFFVAANTGTLEGVRDVRGAQPLDQFRQFLDEHVERAGS